MMAAKPFKLEWKAILLDKTHEASIETRLGRRKEYWKEL